MLEKLDVYVIKAFPDLFHQFYKTSQLFWLDNHSLYVQQNCPKVQFTFVLGSGVFDGKNSIDYSTILAVKKTLRFL